MGLDMYLISLPKISGMSYDEIVNANRYLTKHEQAQDEIYKKVKPYIKHFEQYSYSWNSLYEEMASWRKANQIHQWFVNTLHNGTDDPCFTVEVTKGQLIELQKLCLSVLAKKEHPSYSLPTLSGSFFGNTSYSPFYYREIFETEAILSCLNKNFNFETHYLFYQCSW